VYITRNYMIIADLGDIMHIIVSFLSTILAYT